MELSNTKQLVGNDKTDGAVVANLNILDVSKTIAEVAQYFELTGVAQRSSQLQVSGDCGQASHSPFQIFPEDRIHAEVIEMKIYRSRPGSAQLHVAIDIQFRSLKLRAPVYVQVGTARCGFERIVANRLTVKGKIVPANVRVDYRLLQRAGGLGSEIHAAIDAHAAALQLRNAGEVEVVAGQIKTKRLGRQVVSTVATNVRIVIRQMKLIQRDRVAVEL